MIISTTAPTEAAIVTVVEFEPDAEPEPLLWAGRLLAVGTLVGAMVVMGEAVDGS